MFKEWELNKKCIFKKIIFYNLIFFFFFFFALWYFLITIKNMRPPHSHYCNVIIKQLYIISVVMHLQDNLSCIACKLLI